MKLLRYGRSGKEKPGMLDPDGRIRDLSGKIPDLDGQALSPRSLAKLARLNPSRLPLVPGRPRIGPCVASVPKFVAIGLNFADHAKESGVKPPSEPVVFMKSRRVQPFFLSPPGLRVSSLEEVLAVRCLFITDPP